MSPTPPKPTLVKVHIPHKDQNPIWMYDFIQKVTDVPHCGFRAVAVLRNLIVDDHQIVRYNLYKELVGVGNAHYRRMINDDRSAIGSQLIHGICTTYISRTLAFQFNLGQILLV